jgi:superfamily I DNA and/or RNA helicase
LEKAVRGLRTEAAAFADDGPRQAIRLQERIRQTALEISKDELDALEHAASMPFGAEARGELLKRLQVLKERILNELVRAEQTRPKQAVPPEVELFFTKVLSALRSTIENGIYSKEDALCEFTDRLEIDPEAARRMIENYTSVFAATCQQAAGSRVRDAKNLLKDGPSARFDTVLVDEAARANPLDLFIPMAMADRRIILVGDHRQLPHILDESVERSLQGEATEATKDALGKSLFERLFHSLRNREAKDGASRVITLDTQYRMHPRLGEFVSTTFYERHGEPVIRSGRSADDFPLDVPGFEGRVAAWVDVPGGKGEAQERRGGGNRSWSRRSEARRTADLAKKLMDSAPHLSVGIITFYSGQVYEIRKQLLSLGVLERALEEDDDERFQPSSRYAKTEDRKQERFRLGTVDSFQGIEFDVVLLSVVRSNRGQVPAAPGEEREKALWKRYGFLRLENRLCVAMSRQRRLLCVVGDRGMVDEGSEAKEAAYGLYSFWRLTGEEPHGTRV